MRLLVTGGNHPLVQTIAAALAAEHTIRLFDQAFTIDSANPDQPERITGDFRNP